jgi:hypothetical protein
MSETLLPVPEGYAELFDITASITYLDTNTGKLHLKDEPGILETWQMTRREFFFERGYSSDEYTRLCQMVDEDIIKMHTELDGTTPQDFENQ